MGQGGALTRAYSAYEQPLCVLCPLTLSLSSSVQPMLSFVDDNGAVTAALSCGVRPPMPRVSHSCRQQQLTNLP